MGLFDFWNKKTVDLNENYRRQQFRARQQKQQEGIKEQDNFFGSIAESSKESYKYNPDTGEKYEDKNEEYGDKLEERRKRLSKRLMDMTDKIEELSNKIYNIMQRLELMEKKLRISNSGN